MNELKSNNDALVAFLSNPNASIKDYLQNGITANNTLLLDKEEYKNTPFVKKLFSKDGVFDEGAFEKAYKAASDKYWELTDDEAFKNFLTYNPTSRYKPINAPTYNTSFEVTKGQNPNRVSKSIVGMNVQGQLEKTEEELALMGGIWDVEKKEWRKGTAESLGLASKIFGKTLVYAQYDHSGILENPVTGEVGYHAQNEWMTDKDGNYFTMTISDKDLGNKRVVALGDILTKEDSVINKIDFFDSDGFNKSLGGIAAKTAVSVLPYLIPGVQEWYGALTAVTGLMSVMPTFCKAMDGLIEGDDGKLATPATKAENWFRKFNSSKSRHGQESFFSVESVGDLLADVFGQLHQQQAAASLAKYFKLVPKLENFKTYDDFIKAQKSFNNTAKALSLGYMGLISTSDVYNDAIKGGYDSRTAGLAALASAGALFGIMNFNETANGLGTWFLRKSTGYDREVTRSPLIKVAKSLYKDAETAMDKYVKNGDPTAINKYFGTFWANAKSKMLDIFVVGGESIWSNALVEGVEEVSEEVVQDSVKGIIDALSALGYTLKQGSFGGWDNVFSKEGASRYLQTFFGGALGGALFDLQMKKIDPAMKRLFVDPNYKSEFEQQVSHDLVDVIFEGRTEDLIKEVKNLKSIFNTKKASTGYIDANGNFENVVADGQKSLADAIIDNVITLIREMDQVIKGSLGFLDFSSLSAVQLMALRTTVGQSYREPKLLEYHKRKFEDSLHKMWDAYSAWLNSIKANTTEEKTEKEVSEKEKKSENKESKELKYAQVEANVKTTEDLKKEFEYYRDKCRSIFSGEESKNTLHDMSLINLEDKNLMSFTVLDFDTWYALNYDTPFNNLEKEDDTDSFLKLTQKNAKKRYEAYRASATGDIDTLVERIPILRETYLALLKAVSADIRKAIKHAHKLTYFRGLRNRPEDDILLSYEKELRKQIELAQLEGVEIDELAARDTWNKHILGNLASVAKTFPQAFTLDDRLKFDLASKLEKKGIINLSLFSEEQQKVIRHMINMNAATSGLIAFNREAIEALMRKTNELFSDPSNIYTHKITELELSEREDAESTDASALDTAATAISSKEIVTDFTKIDSDIESAKINDIFEIFADDDVISPELGRMLINYAAALIMQEINKIPGIIEEIALSPEKIFSTIKAVLEENLFSDSADTLLQKMDEALIAAGGSPITTFVEAENGIKEVIKKIKDLVGNKPLLETNPLQTALEQLHFKLHGTSGGSIYKWLFEKEEAFQTSDFTGDTVSISEIERTNLREARQTLVALNAVILGMYVGEEKLDEVTDNKYNISPKGINQILVDYLNAYYDGKGIDDYLVLDKDDFEDVTLYIANLDEKLLTIEKIDSELFKSKSQYYDDLRTTKFKTHRVFYSGNFLRTFKVDLPDELGVTINLLEDFDPDETWTDELFVIRAREAISANIRKLYNKFKGDNDSDKRIKFTKALIKATSALSGNITDTISDAVPSWEAITIEDSGEIVKINGRYLVNDFIRLLYTDPKYEEDLLNDVYKNNAEISPRIDQMDALINIDFAIEHLDVLADVQKAYIDYYHLNLETVKAANLIDKIVLDNVNFLLGSGGSGKTLLLSLIAKKHDNVLVTAMIEDKVNDLKEKSGKEGDILFKLFDGLEKVHNTFTDACSSIITWVNKEGRTNKEAENGKLHLSGLKTENNILSGKYSFEDLEFDFAIDLSDAHSANIDKFTIIKTPEINTDEKLKEGTILFIDECTLLSPLDWQVITKAAKNKNFIVMAAGDPLQPGWNYSTVDQNNVKHFILFDISHYSGNVLGNLAGVWRAENDALQDLITATYTAYSKPRGKDRKALFDFSKDFTVSDEDYALDIAPTILLIPMRYTTSYQGSKYNVLGVALTESDTAAALVKQVENIPEVSRVILVPNGINKEDILKDILENISGIDLSKWQIKTTNEALGNEFDYTFVYGFNQTKDDIIERAKLAFMNLTRAKRAVIIDKNFSKSFSSLGFKDSVQNNTIHEYLADETRDAIASKLAALIDEMSKFAVSVEQKIGIAPEKPKPSRPKGLPVPVIDPLPETRDDEDDKKPEQYLEKTARAWQLAGFNQRTPESVDVTLLETWYFRLGLNTNKLYKPNSKEFNEEITFKELLENINNPEYFKQEGSLTDLLAFVLLLSASRGEITDPTMRTFVTWLGNREVTDETSLPQLIKWFYEFTTYASEHLNEFARAMSYRGAPIELYDVAVEKFNDSFGIERNGKIKPLPQHIGEIVIYNNNIPYYITVGAFAWNEFEDNNKESHIISLPYADIYDALWRLAHDKEIVTRRVLGLHFNKQLEFKRAVKSLYTQDPDGKGYVFNESEFDEEVEKQFPLAKPLVQMSFNSDNSEILKRNAAYGVYDGKVPLRVMTELNYEDVTKNIKESDLIKVSDDGIITIKGEGLLKQKNFLKWVQSFNLKRLPDSVIEDSVFTEDKYKAEASYAKNFAKAQWVVVRLVGSSRLVPTKIGTVVNASQMLNEDQIYTESRADDKGKEIGTKLRSYGHTQLIVGLCKLAGGDFITRFRDLHRYYNSIVPSAENATKVTKAKKALETFFKDLNAALNTTLDAEGLKQLKSLLESYSISVPYSNYWISKLDENDKIPEGTQSPDKIKGLDFIKGSGILTKEDIRSGKINKIVNQLTELGNFFYSNRAVDKNSDSAVIEKFIERTPVLWSITTLSDITTVEDDGKTMELNIDAFYSAVGTALEEFGLSEEGILLAKEYFKLVIEDNGSDERALQALIDIFVSNLWKDENSAPNRSAQVENIEYGVKNLEQFLIKIHDILLTQGNQTSANKFKEIVNNTFRGRIISINPMKKTSERYDDLIKC